MSDVPIIFSAPMVRALLDGRKTMTRRLAWRQVQDKLAGRMIDVPSPWQRVKPGDRLWVREALTKFQTYGALNPTCHYPADDTAVPCLQAVEGDGSGRALWQWEKDTLSSIHMPRWASRLTLIVTATKIERVQEISEDDAEAEGIESDLWDQAVVYRDYTKPGGWFCTWPNGYSEPITHCCPAKIQRRSFQSLWTHLHGHASWDANPEVVALTFQVHKTNIDSMNSEPAP